MTVISLAFLAAGLLGVVAASMFTLASLRLSRTAGMLAGFKGGFFDAPEAASDAQAMICAWVAGMLFTLSGALLDASFAVA